MKNSILLSVISLILLANINISSINNTQLTAKKEVVEKYSNKEYIKAFKNIY